jgi:high-affinity iron transporter
MSQYTESRTGRGRKVPELLGQYLIAFREVLEAALIVSIVLTYLTRTGRSILSRFVWLGAVSATVTSIILGLSIWLVYGLLSKSVQALFEGVAALIALAVLSSMIHWMATKGRELRGDVERRVEAIATRGAALGLVSFSFIAVFREGLETVLFLTPFLVTDPLGTAAGLFLGVLTSLAFAYVVFVAGMKINIRRFFYFTSILLILLAGGLAGYGMHELVEYTGPASWGWLAQPAYDLNIPSDSPLHHKGIVGSIFAVMFGYTIKAEWIRVIVQLLYLAVALPSVTWIYRRK